jgi:predicted ribosomally synthesized peptide with SipW-like signal peptide
MKKRTLIILMSAVLVAGLAVGGTLAYFTATQTATNTFTVGNVKISLTEPNWVASGSVDAPEAYPGEPLAKDPTITNTGKNPCVVRIKITWPTLPAGVSAIQLRTDYVLGKLGNDWYQDGDYYYYMKLLEIGSSTDALFDQVVMPTDLQNGDASTHYDIVVTAEAVQAQGIFSKYADMADGISRTTAPANSSTIEFDLVKQMFLTAFGH